MCIHICICNVVAAKTIHPKDMSAYRNWLLNSNVEIPRRILYRLRQRFPDNYKDSTVRKRWLTAPENPLQTLTHLSTDQQDIVTETPHDLYQPQPGVSNEEENIAWMSSLHEQSPLSVGESCLLILSFAVRHHLTKDAIGDLLKFLNCHFPNTFVESKFLFFKHFDDILKIEKHFYCMKCVNYLGMLTEEENMQPL